MKTIKITLVLFLCSFVINAQETYKHSLSGIKKIKIFTNTSVELKIGASNQLVIDEHGSDPHFHKNISSIFRKNADIFRKNADTFSKKKSVKDKTKGLKPLYSNGNDNTGYGLEITKDGNTLIIRDLKSFTESGNFVIQIPKGIDISLDCGNLGNAKVTRITSDIEVKTIMGNIELINITGPVTASTSSGDITAIFAAVNQSSPISLRTSMGDIDVSLSSNTKANLEMKTSMGTVYSNFEFKAQANKSLNTIKSKRNIVESKRNIVESKRNIVESKRNIVGSKEYIVEFEVKRKRTINRTLNNGGVRISLKSSTGNVYLRKK